MRRAIKQAAECGMRTTFRKFGFLASRGGRGCAAVFIGSIAMSIGWQFANDQEHVYWIVIAGMYDVAIGALLLLTYTCVSTGKTKGVKNKDEADLYQGLADDADEEEGTVSSF